jgi:hypothetical protein
MSPPARKRAKEQAMMRIVTTVSVGVAFMLPFMARAEMTDAQYCQAMVDKYRTASGGTQNNQAVAEAMDQCAKGNAAAGIPVMEKALKDAKVTLPARN